MSVVAKMRCERVDANEHQQSVSLTAVLNDTVENKLWSKFTPAGGATLVITNQDAFGKFTPGKEYLVTFDEIKASPA